MRLLSPSLSLAQKWFVHDNPGACVSPPPPYRCDCRPLQTSLAVCRIMSMVGQEPVLFARTIRENIQYGLEDESIPMEKYEKHLL